MRGRGVDCISVPEVRVDREIRRGLVQLRTVHARRLLASIPSRSFSSFGNGILIFGAWLLSVSLVM